MILGATEGKKHATDSLLKIYQRTISSDEYGFVVFKPKSKILTFKVLRGWESRRAANLCGV